jgi:hypothetical protein
MHNDIQHVIDSFRLISSTQYTMNGKLRDIEKISIINASENSAIETLNEKMRKILITDIYNNFYNASEADCTGQAKPDTLI